MLLKTRFLSKIIPTIEESMMVGYKRLLYAWPPITIIGVVNICLHDEM
ncbi:MAG: hypothetical protein NZ750_13920 [Anaerolineae bacterium]|nr:hypothetical protein [Anaerolineae bacterium]MDW8171713.1 hypothetical protein [Anaerolineae bacterium]